MHRTNFHQPKNMNLTPTHEFMPDQPSESREPNHPKGKMILPTTNPNRLDVCGDAQECAWMQVELGKLKTENAALRKDKERLDWLIQFGGATFYKRLPHSLSEAYIAIDTRRKETK